MKNKKNLYALLVLFSYPIAVTIMTVLRIISMGEIWLDDTSLKLITLSVIVFSVMKYKDAGTKQK